MKVILFQGDSVTDAGRRDDHRMNLGYGYPTLVKGALGATYPGLYRFENRGVSGNRIVDVYARIKRDILNLEPSYMSLLIGVNDVWHEIDMQNGVDTPKFERIYRMLLDEIYEALPEIKIMLLEPFCLPGGATQSDEDPTKWTRFNDGVREHAAAARRVAEDYHLPFIPLQQIFDDACKLAGPDYWTLDGVHPVATGHELIKRAWIETFEKMK